MHRYLSNASDHEKCKEPEHARGELSNGICIQNVRLKLTVPGKIPYSDEGKDIKHASLVCAEFSSRTIDLRTY